MAETVRVTSAQMDMRPLAPDAFFARLRDIGAAAAAENADFLVFPEWYVLQILAAEPRRTPAEAMERLCDLAGDLVDTLGAIATGSGINVIGGSHPIRQGNAVRNVCHVALRDGGVHLRAKLHPTPDEGSEWAISGGNAMDAIDTDCGKIGVAICYDSEFPEPVRRLADQGAGILFVPYFTETRHGHLRVRYCCQARAVENQTYVVTSGIAGTIDGVENAERGYAQSAVLTPCDLPFAPDGIAAEAEPNAEQLIFADLDMARLDWARREGHVRNMADRRSDLYSVDWRGDA